MLGFHKFRDILSAAEPAKAQLRRQLQRVLASQTAETLPAAAPTEPAAKPVRKRRLPSLKQLTRGGGT